MCVLEVFLQDIAMIEQIAEGQLNVLFFVNRALDRELYSHLQQEGFTEISDYSILNNFLSPVRYQGRVGSCAFVSAVACVEMHYRISSIKIKNSDCYCFDIVDVYDNLYSVLPFLTDAETLKHDVMCHLGAQVSDVLWYIKTYGLKSSTICTNPLERNLHSIFDQRVRSNCHIRIHRLNLMSCFCFLLFNRKDIQSNHSGP